MCEEEAGDSAECLLLTEPTVRSTPLVAAFLPSVVLLLLCDVVESAVDLVVALWASLGLVDDFEE